MYIVDRSETKKKYLNDGLSFRPMIQDTMSVI